MHSLSWWRMVGRVMESEGGAPLTNEIKIFKHCFTTLPVPLCYLATAGGGRTPSRIWHHGCVITHPTTFVLVGFKVRYTPPPPPPSPPCLVSSTVVSLSLPSEAIRRGSHWQPRLSLYISSLYLSSLHSFRLLQPHSATIMWQWGMQVLNRPVYSIPSANWPRPINNGGPGALWLINGRASAPFHYT